MKYLIILSMWLLFTITLQYKAVYRIKVHRAEIPRSNNEYGKGRVWITKPDRYTNAVNGEFSLYKVPQDTKIKLKAYEFLHNEYRPFAINLERWMCHFMELEYKMMFYPDLLKVGAHMPEPRCPLRPGNYSFANFTPDDANYPTTLPFHNFMVEIAFWHGSVEMGVLQIYATLDRDAVIREQYA